MVQEFLRPNLGQTLSFTLIGEASRHESVTYCIQYLTYCSKRGITIRRECLIKSFSGNPRFLCCLCHTFCSCYCIYRFDESRRIILLCYFIKIKSLKLISIKIFCYIKFSQFLHLHTP